MIALRYWRTLCHPPSADMVYQRVMQEENVRRRFRSFFRSSAFDVLYIAFLIVVPVAVFLAPLVAGTIYGLYWAVEVATAIAHQRQRGTHDLLCLLPGGQFPAYHMLTVANVRRCAAFVQMRTLTTVTLTITAGLLLMTLSAIGIQLSATGLNPASRHVLVEEFGLLLTIAAIGFGLYMDQVQSATIGSLLGMLVPTLGGKTEVIRLIALSSFVGVQMLAYGAVGVLGFGLLPRLISHTAILWTARTLMLFGLRDLIVFGLWRVIYRRLHT